MHITFQQSSVCGSCSTLHHVSVTLIYRVFQIYIWNWTLYFLLFILEIQGALHNLGHIQLTVSRPANIALGT